MSHGEVEYQKGNKCHLLSILPTAWTIIISEPIIRLELIFPSWTQNEQGFNFKKHRMYYSFTLSAFKALQTITFS